MKFNSGHKFKITKSKSFSNFKRRELSQTEKSLLDKYNNEKKPKKNLKLNFYNKKIKEIKESNKDNMKMKSLKIYDNYYDSIIINNKNKEYYKNLYNDENIDISNKQQINNINNNNEQKQKSNFQKSILLKTKNILELNSKNYSYNNIFDANKNNNITNLQTINDNKKMDDVLYNRNKDNKLYISNTMNNKSINPYMIKPLKYNNISKIYRKKLAQKRIKNKIVYKAVKTLKEKRNENNSEIKKYDNFNTTSVYKNLKLEKFENTNYKNTWLRYSSIMTDLINKNKKKFVLK